MADPKPVYVRNAKGGVHSVTEEHYKSLLEEDGTLPKNWQKLTETEAKKAAPALFGLDEHGQPIQAEAAAKPVTAADVVNAIGGLAEQLKAGK